MRRVKVITDSGVDLPKEILEERGIDVVMGRIVLGKNSYPDDRSISQKELFEFIKKTGTLPEIAEASEYEFQKVFQKWLGEDYDIFFIGVSGKLAPTMRIALSATKNLVPGRISVVDSLSASSGIGLQALEAADLADQGAGLLEITNHAYAIRPKARLNIVLDTLKYVYMGGQCSRLTSIMAGTLGIKPMIDIIDGEMVPGETLRGRNYIDKFLAKVMENQGSLDPKRIFVTQCLADEAGEVKERLEREYGFANVIVSEASPGVAINCGPGAIGVMYRYK